MLHENDSDDVMGPIIVGWCLVAYLRVFSTVALSYVPEMWSLRFY
jgi:hypothetical protein